MADNRHTSIAPLAPCLTRLAMDRSLTHSLVTVASVFRILPMSDNLHQYSMELSRYNVDVDW